VRDDSGAAARTKVPIRLGIRLVWVEDTTVRPSDMKSPAVPSPNTYNAY
jgi:hypothetical protein